MTDAQKQALNYLVAACRDYANTLPPSVRGPFERECGEAVRILTELAQPEKPDPKA